MQPPQRTHTELNRESMSNYPARRSGTLSKSRNICFKSSFLRRFKQSLTSDRISIRGGFGSSCRLPKFTDDQNNLLGFAVVHIVINIP